MNNIPQISESCGVIGIFDFNNRNVFPYVYWGLVTLNHRGHQSYGFVTYDGVFHSYKNIGLVSDIDQTNFRKLSEELLGFIGIGHVRYATSGEFSKLKLIVDAQPIIVESNGISLSLAYNGNIANILNLRRMLSEKGFKFEGSGDAEVLAKLLSYLLSSDKSLPKAVKHLMGLVDGAYSVVGLLSNGTLFAFRDPHGIRPLVYGISDDKHMFTIASESVALNVNKSSSQAFVKNGELIIVRDGRIEKFRLVENFEEKLCAFEYAYFSRPDSKLHNDRYVYEVRRELGRKLAKRYWHVAERVDFVVPVPQTAIEAAYGFHEVSGKPVEPLIVRHRYVKQRAFILSSEERKFLLSRKYNFLFDRFGNSKIALIDDSIVRGDTLKHIVKILRTAGVREVHVFSTFPKIIGPCFYGIDMSTFDELIGFNRSDLEIANIIGADSVNYQTIEDFVSAVGSKNLCLGCLTTKYPTKYANKIALIAKEKALKGVKLKGRISETIRNLNEDAFSEKPPHKVI